MKIKIEGVYKSLKNFESEELNDFTVITGKNGSGKSQLIELIKQNFERSQSPYTKVIYSDQINKIKVEGLNNSTTLFLTNQDCVSLLTRYYEEYTSLKIYFIVINNLIVSDFNINNIFNINWEDLLHSDSTQDKYEILKGIVYQRSNGTFKDLGDKTKVIDYFKSDLYNLRRTIQVIIEVSHFRNKDISNLENVDFLKTPLREFLIDDNRLFYSSIERIFYAYARKRDINNRQYFNKKEYDEKNDSISNTEFRKLFPPPWELINQILIDLNLGFYFTGVEEKNFSQDSPVEFKLIKSSSQVEIDMTNLSSGELIIINLIKRLFISEFYNDNMEFPDLMVFDELDAFLHPEMSYLLIEVLYETFVKKYGIKVIITTHSPSTLALCPEESIYELKNEPTCSLKKVSKDDALKILTGFLPTLSIDYKNHRQVFVESPVDRYYYQSLFEKINQDKGLTFRLYFISNDAGKGNCQQVIDLVKNIRSSGNTTSFSIVDWDNKNKSDNYTIVHGENTKYSIENFLLNPIYLAILFLELNGAHNIGQDLGFEKTYNQFKLVEEGDDRIQSVVEWFLNKIYSKFPVFKQEDGSRTSCDFLNGKKLNIPKWYCNIKGHDLEIKLREVFECLKKYDSNNLSQKMTEIISKCYPCIPIETALILEKIASPE